MEEEEKKARDEVEGFLKKLKEAKPVNPNILSETKVILMGTITKTEIPKDRYSTDFRYSFDGYIHSTRFTEEKGGKIIIYIPEEISLVKLIRNLKKRIEETLWLEGLGRKYGHNEENEGSGTA